MTLRRQILELRNTGHNYDEIASKLNCSKGTISYHCNASVKKNTLKNQTKWRRKNTLACKLHNFKHFNPQKRKLYETGTNDPLLNLENLIKKFGEYPKCYLTGEPIDLNNANEYSLDHITPLSKGGKNTLDNCGLITKDVNQFKSDMKLEDLYSICELILKIKAVGP